MKKTAHRLIKLIPSGLKEVVPERMKQKIKSWISYSTSPAAVDAENEDQHQKETSRINQNSVSRIKEPVESVSHFPDIRLVTIDRPKELFGFNAKYCIGRGGAERHYYIERWWPIISPGAGMIKHCWMEY